MLDVSFCVQQRSLVWPEAGTVVQIALGVLTSLLVAIEFIRQSLQMYRVTKRFELSHYMNLLMREGMFYFLAYVHVSPSYFCLHPIKLTLNDDE